MSPIYLPITILRKIRGCFYDKDYNPLLINEQFLSELLSNFKNKRIVVKPAVDGESGR